MNRYMSYIVPPIAMAAALAGRHHYCRISVFDAVARVQRTLDEAGLRYRAVWGRKVPNAGMSVGQVRVRSGDRPYVLSIVAR